MAGLFFIFVMVVALVGMAGDYTDCLTQIGR
jgi:hypothetical protein